MNTTTNPLAIRHYMSVQGTFFASQGLQMVMFPFLVVDELGMSANLVGIAQAAITLPTFLLMLAGGALADARDSRTILTVVHSMAAIVPLTLAAIILAGGLSYGVVIAYGVAMGTLGAFAQPARDSMLTRVVVSSGTGMGLQRAVTLATLVMFSSQIVGMILASRADYFGAGAIMAAQALILAISVIFIRMMNLVPVPDPDHEPGLKFQINQMRDGLREAWNHKQIMPVITVAFFIGIFYMGAFNVILPLQIREFHGGGSGRFALMSMAFFSGTIVSTMALFRIGGLIRAGRAMTLAVLVGASVLAFLSFPLPFWALCATVFVWGMGAGVTITLSRGIVQELAPESHRGRLLAVFSMGFMGGAPFGSFGMGFLIDLPFLNPLNACLIPAALMTICLMTLVARTELWSVRLPRHSA